MKTCKDCGLTKPLNEFSLSCKKRNQLCTYCKPCHALRINKQRHSFKTTCVKYKGSICCRCSKAYPIACYDFQHKFSEDKAFNISRYYGTRWTEKLQFELDKCDLLCSNCHKEQHFVEFCDKLSTEILNTQVLKDNRKGVLRRRKLKADCVDSFGHYCQHCKYWRCQDALEFHHLDRSIKDFSFKDYWGHYITPELTAELSKCILLCSNCHRIAHATDHDASKVHGPLQGD